MNLRNTLLRFSYFPSGPLSVVVSFLDQRMYAEWLLTHKAAKQHKFGCPTVHIAWKARSRTYYADWWFHKRSVRFSGPIDLQSPDVQGWDQLHLSHWRYSIGGSLPDCRQLTLTDIWGRSVHLSATTKRLIADSKSWEMLTLTNISAVTYFELRGASHKKLWLLLSNWSADSKLEHLVIRLDPCDMGPHVRPFKLDRFPCLKVVDIYASRGTFVSSVCTDPRLRVHIL